MSNLNPTVVIAQLDDEKLRASIDSLVTHFNSQLEKMKKDSTSAVQEITQTLNKLGEIKVDMGGSANGGSSRRAKAQTEEAKAVKDTAMAYDQLAKVQQVAVRSGDSSSIRNADVLQTMNVQLDLLRERLREARQQYSSFVALAAHATTTGDKGLFQFATEGVHRYEQEVHNLIPQIRNLQAGVRQMGDVIAPQGHTMQNYVNSLQKANPELALLNERFKSGKSLFQQQASSLSQATQAIQDNEKTMAQSVRTSKLYTQEQTEAYRAYRKEIQETASEIRRLQKEYPNITQTYQERTKSGNTFTAQIYAENDARAQGLSIEEQILRAIRQRVEEDKAYIATVRQTNGETQQQLNIERQITEEQNKRKKYKEPTISPAFEKMVANSLGLKTSEVESSAKGIQRLNVYLNQLQQTWNRLTPTMQNSNFGRMLKEEFQTASRYVQQLRKDLSTPINLNAALKGSEKTLDDIAYKMQRLQAYRSGLDINTQTNEINQVNAALERLKKQQDEVMNKNQGLTFSNQALARSWNYMKNRLAFYFTVGASTQFVKNLIEVRSQYEMNERALGILIDSAERGMQIFNELSQMALVSPYTLIELSTAAKQLSAYDIAAKDLVDTTRRLADMSAAVGIPVERLTTALGQIKSFEHLTSLTARRFASAGIPLVKQLAEYYTDLEGKMVSVADVYDMMKKRQIGFNDVMQVIYRMTDEGGKFFDYQAKMAGTLKVQLANLTLAWNNMLNDIGGETQGIFVTFIGWLKKLFLAWKTVDGVIKQTLGTLVLYKLGAIGLVRLGYAQTIPALRATAKQMVRLRQAMDGTAFSLSSLVANWQLLAVAAAAYLAVDIYRTVSRNNEEISRFNENIAKGAKEASNSIDELLKSETMLEARNKSGLGKMDVSDAQKTWGTLREEIELSAASADSIIPHLLNIDDLNQRVSKSFKLADAISDAQKALSNLTNELDFSQDSILNGLFGEGLAEDLEDYNRALSATQDFAKRMRGGNGLWENLKLDWNIAADSISQLLSSDIEEAYKEVGKFSKETAKSVRKLLGEDIFKDTEAGSAKVAEAVARIRQEIFNNPKIKGEGKNLLLTGLDMAFIKEFKNLYSQQDVIANRFLEQLHKDYASTFNSITSDILDKNDKWNEAQVDAFRKTYDKIKQDIPSSWAETLDKMLQDMNSRDWTIRVMAKFDINSLTDVQKDFRKQFIENRETGGLVGKEADKQREENQRRFGRLMRKDGEDNVEYEKRITDEKKKQQEILEKNQSIYNNSADKQSAIAKDAKKAADDAKQWLKDAKEVEDWGGYDFTTKEDKKKDKEAKKAQKQAETELQKVIKEEVSLINKARSAYKNLTKEGVDSTKALTVATSGYERSIRKINDILAKNGLRQLDLSKYVGIENPRPILDLLNSQLSSGRLNRQETETIEGVIRDLKIDVVSFDQKTLINSLNNELAKLKDEYELAVELDANPELGNIFTDIFDIDPNELPHNLDEYAERVTDALNKSFEKQKKNFRLPTIELTDDDLKAYKAESEKANGLITEADYKEIEKQTKDIRNLRKKDREDTLKKTQELQYKLGDINEKIAIETKKLTNLQIQAEKEKNAEKKALLDLEIQQQQEVINKLGEDVLQMLPTYKNLFNSIAEHSAVVTRRIAKQWKDALENATRNADGSYTITDPTNGKKATISEKQYGKELDRVNGKLRETQAAFAKIKEALTKGDDKTIDWAKGLELIAEEARKAADGVRTVAEIFDALGGDEDTTEILNDVATSMEGIATAGQGVSQIASGDYIGGTVNVIKGAWEAISTWFDNDNKKIDRQIEKSKFKVQELELAYKKLEYAAKKALGTEETSAKRESIAVKEQELAELERQLALEQQKDYKKDSDEREQKERIQDYLDSIESLKQEIQDAKEEIVNNLLGGDVKSAAEEFVDTWVEAWRAGETTLDAIEEKMDEMIFNLIKKSMTSKIVENLLNPFYNEVNRMTSAESEMGDALTINELRQLAQMAGITAEQINTALGEFYGNLDALDIISQSSEANKQLSSLQQGIQNITEDTAGALEAYMNGVSQQVYLHSQLLTEIRNAVVSMDNDIQMGIQAQMLLQLQQSYAVQMAIQNILLGWSNPSGMAVKVEMI